jgi:hypothetical protein
LPTLYSLPSTDFYSISSAANYPGVFGPVGGWWSFGGFPFRSPSSGLGSGVSLAATTTPGSSSSSSSNTVTGLGSPIGWSLVSGLVTSNLTVPLTTTSGSNLQGTNGPPSPLHPKGGKQHRPVRHGHNKAAKKTHAAVQAGHKLVAQGAAAHHQAATRHGLL